jgi:hypothetical protein
MTLRICAHHGFADVFSQKDLRRTRLSAEIVESRRQDDQVRQQVIATLGRYDELRDSGHSEHRSTPPDCINYWAPVFYTRASERTLVARSIHAAPRGDGGWLQSGHRIA